MMVTMMHTEPVRIKLKLLFHENILAIWLKLVLTWSKNCVLADMTVRTAGTNNDPPAIVAPYALEF